MAEIALGFLPKPKKLLSLYDELLAEYWQLEKRRNVLRRRIDGVAHAIRMQEKNGTR
ncbi:MAG: hypothetical protein P4N59_03400 [Negativicutes bacterium]|nr:hypothetical protein [Negativicutes bacterium]